MAFEKLTKFISIFCLRMRYTCVLLVLALAAVGTTAADDTTPLPIPFRPMRLDYRVEWRLVTAGTADLAFTRDGSNKVGVKMKLESTGLLTHLYRVLDTYQATMNNGFCLESAHMDAQEGKRHIITDIAVQGERPKSVYEERDLVKNTSKQTTLDVPSCTYDITGALAELRELDVAAPRASTLPITDGKKFARVRIVPQGKETVTVSEKKYQTVRYEAFLFDNVLYKRKGSLQIWLSDDAVRVPVLMRFQFGFPVGSISVELVKQQDL